MKKNERTDCGFEYIYYFNSADNAERESVGAIRFQAGCELAKIFCVKGDIVVPVPNTAREVAKGYSYTSGIRLCEAIIAKEKAGRYFLKKTAEERERTVQEKFVYLPEEIKGKDIILIDDSIVRGVTTKAVIKHLREHGAGKIHMLIASSPVINICERIMVSSKEELIATNRTIRQICDLIGADSLHYLPLDIAVSVYCSNRKLCLDCFT